MDENNNVLWSEWDQLVAFMGTTLSIKYQIKEQYVGTATEGFSKINKPGNEDDLESGQGLWHNSCLSTPSDKPQGGNADADRRREGGEQGCEAGINGTAGGEYVI